MSERTGQELLVETEIGVVVRIQGETALVPIGPHGEIWRGPFTVTPGAPIAVHGPRGIETLDHLGAVISTFTLMTPGH
jgi:hypothetical protein